MITHIVMWNLKDAAEGGTREQNAARIRSGLEALAGKVEGLRSLKVGYNFTPGGYDLCLLAKCDSRAALEVYQNDPRHLEMKKFIHKVITERVVCDFEDAD